MKDDPIQFIQVHIGVPNRPEAAIVFGADAAMPFAYVAVGLRELLRSKDLLRSHGLSGEFGYYGSLRDGSICFGASDRNRAFQVTRDFIRACCLASSAEIAYLDSSEAVWRTGYPEKPSGPFSRWLTPELIEKRKQISVDAIALVTRVLKTFE